MPAEIFYSYAHQDELLRQELEKHLTILKRQQLITTWHSREVTAGTEWKKEIDAHLDKSHIILPLLSPDFVASDYCYERQMKRALERHNAKVARVVPVILRPVDWKNTPFSELQVLPKSGKPITSWPGRYGRDKAFLEVALGIRDVVTALKYWSYQARVEELKSTKYPETPEPTPLAYADLDSYIAMLHGNRAIAYFDSKRYEEALAIYEQALRLDPNNAAAYSGKGDTLRQLNRETEALAAYGQALRLDPNDSTIYSSKGDIHRSLFQYEEALAAYGQALRLDLNNAAAYSGKGNIHRSLGQYEEALAAYGQALRLDPNDSIYVSKGDMHNHLGQFEEALAAYEQALRLDPNNVNARISKQRILQFLGRSR
jgi:tetratricopeptide (TPR) repeat protein